LCGWWKVNNSYVCATTLCNLHEIAIKNIIILICWKINNKLIRSAQIIWQSWVGYEETHTSINWLQRTRSSIISQHVRIVTVHVKRNVIRLLASRNENFSETEFSHLMIKPCEKLYIQIVTRILWVVLRMRVQAQICMCIYVQMCKVSKS